MRICTKESVLHQQSKEITDKNVASMCKDLLIDEFNSHNGRVQGIAAIQIKLHYAAILVRYKKGREPQVLFNPKLIKSYGSWKKLEACLSEPNKYYMVSRPLLAKVSYMDSDLVEHTKWLTYKKARIFMHELDHVNGLMLKDKNVMGVKL